MDVFEAQATLHQLRRVLAGYGMACREGWPDDEGGFISLFISQVGLSSAVLDLYLTDEQGMRGPQDARAILSLGRSAIPRWIMILSDGESQIVFQMANSKDKRLVYLLSATQKVTKRWQRIDIEATHQTGFPDPL